MDDIDRSIIFQLQLDGRLPNNELADRVGLTPSPCLRRTRLLEGSGIIQRYTAIVDPTAIGRGFEVLLWVTLKSVTRDSMATIEAAFERLEEVTEAHRMMGQPDYLIRVGGSRSVSLRDVLHRRARWAARCSDAHVHDDDEDREAQPPTATTLVTAPVASQTTSTSRTNFFTRSVPWLLVPV